jgi:hypothetical protein
MSSNKNLPFDPTDSRELEKFRKSAAGILRDILSAVHQHSPGFLPDDVRRQWFNGRNQPSELSIERLLRNAASNLGSFPDRFGGSLNSLPFSEETEASCVEERCEELYHLVFTFTGVNDLVKAAGRFEGGKPFAWDKVCVWDSLPRIRQLLDDLSKSSIDNPSPSEDQFQKSVERNGLAAEPPNLICFAGTSIRAKAKVWKALWVLLHSAQLFVEVGNFYEAVWGKEWNENGSKSKGPQIWGSVDSLLREVRKLLKEWPFTVKGSRSMRHVQLIPNVEKQDGGRQLSSKSVSNKNKK